MLQAFSHADDSAYDHRIVCIGRDLLHEGLIDFEHAYGKPPQVAEAGVTGPEIIAFNMKYCG
jgi:hypothetical protein